VWGGCRDWPEIPGEDTWIDEMHALRVQIAHGMAAVDVESVEATDAKAKVLQSVAQKFLQAWRDRHFGEMFALAAEDQT
jgi:hypothetical protein